MGKKILLAGRNRQLAENITNLLVRHGFEVAHRADGAAVLQQLAAEPPDLLLLDLKLSGLQSVELLRKLRQSARTSALPVIVINSAARDDQAHAAVRRLGVEHYLQQPFKAADLIAAVRAQLEVLPDSAAGEPKPFDQHLRTAFLKRFSGQAVLTYPDTVRTLIFINGAPVALRPGYQSRDFGDYLLGNGQITTEEYAYFTTTGAYRHDCLVQIGCLEYADLLQAELDYLERELVSAFAAGPAKAAWKVMPAPALVQLITLNVPQLFYDGYHAHPGEAATKLLQTFRQRFVSISGEFYRLINFLKLSDREKRFIITLDGQVTVEDVTTGGAGFGPLLLTLASLNMIRFTAEPTASADAGDMPIRALFNAVEDEEDLPAADEPLERFDDLVDDEEAAVGAISAAPRRDGEPPGPATDDLAQEVRFMAKSLEGQNHYEVFGIKPAKFSIDLLKERYFAITRKFGPEVLMQLGGEEAVLVEKILSTVATAYDTLSDVVKKERYDERLGSDKIGIGQEGDDRFQAEIQAESGKVFLEMEDWDNAEKSLQEAVNFDSNNGDYLASLAWAIYHNPRYADSEAMQNKARQMLNKAITMERTAQGFAFKGWMLLEGGQDTLAEAEFNKALKLDARQMMARKGLRTIREQREQKKKGLFKKMFR